METTKGIRFNGSSWVATIYQKEIHKNTHIGSFKTKKNAVDAKRKYIKVHYPNGYSADTHFHGQWGTRLYWIWNGMIYRCENPKHKHYSYYGGKGVTIYEEWHKFAPFSRWALSHGYKDNLTIDRIDGTKGYSPNNCRWATRSEQVINRPMRKDFDIFLRKKKYYIEARRKNIVYKGGSTYDIETARKTRDNLIRILSEKDVAQMKAEYLEFKKQNLLA